VTPKKEELDKKVYEVSIDKTEDCKDVFLHIDYAGDSAKAFLNGELIADHFYTGEPWQIGLRTFDFPSKLKIEIYPLKEDAKVFLETWPSFKNGVACEINDVIGRVEYHAIIK